MADAAALIRTASNTTKIASALRNQWDVRTKTRATLNDGAAMDMAIRAQIDEVFLVLAHLGEAVLALGVFNKDYYLQTLGEVQASIDSCGHELLPMAWAELDAELQYVCTAGFTICACYSPMPVYRGFGACVLGDWDWACPDIKFLEEKAQKKAIRTVYGFKQKVDAQPMRSVFIAFDHVIQILQVKAMAFLEKRPVLSSFSDHQARYGPRPKKEVKDDLDLFEDWVKQLEKRGHPAPKGTRLSSWGIPYATWSSPYSCHVLKTEKDCETIMCNQMDPGRLLHSFVCRGGINLEEGQILLLPPRSPAESLVCWLEGLPNTSHKTVKWEDLDTERFETKISKSLRKKIGRYPLPSLYAVRYPQAASRSTVTRNASLSPNVLEHPNTVSPPPYSPSKTKLVEGQTSPVAELGNPDPRELPSTPLSSSQSPPQHSSSLPVPGAESSGLKSIHNLRRKTHGGTSTTTSGQSAKASVPRPTSTAGKETQPESPSASTAAELPEDTAEQKPSELESPAAVELPTDYQSEAPKDLTPGSANPVELPATQESSSKDSGSKTEGNIDEPPVISEEPESMTTETNVDIDKNPNGSASEAGGASQYLELLNKVAKGELSPQALAELLAKGSLTSSVEKTESTSPVLADEVSKTESAPSKALQSTSGNLPYPLSPTERQKNEWTEQNKSATGAPYPETPKEETSTNANENDVPASLKPGL